MSEEIVKIEISNNGLFAYYPVFGGCFVALLTGIILAWEFLFGVFIAVTIVGIISTLLIKLIEPRGANASWGSPNIYNFKGSRLVYYEYSVSKPTADTDLSTVFYLKFINHKYWKRIKILSYQNGKEWLDVYSAPFFEKCNDDWQRLFDEIRKRIPGDSEVIVK